MNKFIIIKSFVVLLKNLCFRDKWSFSVLKLESVIYTTHTYLPTENFSLSFGFVGRVIKYKNFCYTQKTTTGKRKKVRLICYIGICKIANTRLFESFLTYVLLLLLFFCGMIHWDMNDFGTLHWWLLHFINAWKTYFIWTYTIYICASGLRLLLLLLLAAISLLLFSVRWNIC